MTKMKYWQTAGRLGDEPLLFLPDVLNQAGSGVQHIGDVAFESISRRSKVVIVHKRTRQYCSFSRQQLVSEELTAIVNATHNTTIQYNTII